MDKNKAVAVLQIIGAAAIPVAAFLLRMLEGDTRNANEEVISDWLIRKTRGWERHGSD